MFALSRKVQGVFNSEFRILNPEFNSAKPAL